MADEPKTVAAAKYGREMGDRARLRQERLAKFYFVCCGEHRESGHHRECPNFVEEAPAIVHPDQETLL